MTIRRTVFAPPSSNTSITSDETTVASEPSGNTSITSDETKVASEPSGNTLITSDASEPSGFFVEKYLDLQRAAMEGNWEEIETLLRRDPGALTADISGREETVLFTAVMMGHAGVVGKLLNWPSLGPDVLTKKNIDGDTVLHAAAAGESRWIVRKLVERSPQLTQIMNKRGDTPLMVAVNLSNREIVGYLLEKTTDDAPGSPFSGPRSGTLITNLIYSGLYDVALDLLNRYHKLAIEENAGGYNLLSSLALKPLDFKSGSNLRRWELWIYDIIPIEINNVDKHGRAGSDEENLHLGRLRGDEGILLQVWIKKLTWKVMKRLVPGIKEIEQEKRKHRYINELIHNACEAISRLIEEGETDHSLTIFDRGLYEAAENGIIEIITICFQHFPTLLPLADKKHRSIFHRAIEHRREKILNLLYVKTAYNKVQPTFLTKSGETYLHEVAKLAPYPQLRSIPCPAIQMQREIQWFKAIEKLTPSYQRAWPKGGQTAHQLFTTEHEKLVEEAEKWMKDTSNSCMLVSTLIATVVFAAAFTVPGGNLEGKGTPIFIMKEIFMVFAISDALALFSSITSVLMFLSILTARYAEQDFLYALPKRLIFGLSFLFIAIAAMMVAFGSALQIMLNDKWEWFHVPIMLLLGALPVVLFMMLQVPLFAEMVWSTYGPSIFRPQRIW